MPGPLHRNSDKTTISGIGEHSQRSKGTVRIKFWSRLRQENQITFEINAVNLPNLISWLLQVNKHKDEGFKDINLADPEFYITGKMDLILGADVYKDIL